MTLRSQGVALHSLASCTAGMLNLRAGSGPKLCYIPPSEQAKKYEKRLLNDVNDGDFLNEFELH